MRAIIYKELRELAVWAVLCLVGIITSTFAVLQESFYLRPVANIFTQELFLQMIVAPSIAALILAFRQTLPELWRDQWAFLVQRGVSMTQIFFAKVIAATVVYGLIVLTALLMAVVCCCWNGVDRFPFEWRMLLAPLAASVGAFGFYFVAMQCVVRQAGHYVTRILPLTLPGVLLFGVVFIHSEVNESGTSLSWITLMVSTGLFGLMAWGSFISHGDIKRTPGIARLAIGVPTYAAFMAGYFAFWLSVVVVVDFLQDEFDIKIAPSLTEQTQWNHLHVAKDGRVFQSRLTRRTDHGIVFEHAVDIDQPQFVTTTNANTLTQLDEAYVPTSISLWSYLGWSQGTGVLERITSGGDDRRLYSETRGVIFKYSNPRDVSYPGRPLRERIRRQPGQLVSVVTPDGFQSSSRYLEAASGPPRRFGKLIGVLGSWRGRGDRVIARRGSTGTPVIDVRTVVLFDNGLFEINFESESVVQHYVPPSGKLIRSLSALGESEVVVAFSDNSLSHYSAKPISFDIYPDTRPKLDEDAPSTTAVLVPGKLNGTNTIPAEVQTFRGFSFGVLDAECVYHSYGALSSLDIDRIVKTDHTGTVTEVRAVNQVSPALPLPACVALIITAGLAPAGPVSLGVLADAASQSMSGFGPGIVGRTLLRSPTRTVLVLLVQFLSAWLAAWLAGRFAARRGMSRTVCRRWQWISLFWGPAAALTLASLHDNDNCEHCGAAQQAPASDGTEIIGTLPRRAGSSSSEAAAELAV